MSLPFPTRKNSLALTIYCLGLVALLLILNYLFPGSPAPLTFNNLSKLGEQGSLLSLGLIGILTLWLFFAGLVILAIYAFFLPHKHQLKKPRKPFITFYFVFVSWFTIFISFDLLMLFAGLNLNLRISSYQTALIINLILTFLVNSIALVVMFRYLTKPSMNFSKSSLRLLSRWLKKLIWGNQKYKIKQLILWGILGYIAFYPLLILTSGANVGILKLIGKDFPIQPIVQLSIQNESLLVSILLFISITILAPFFEEIIMRGLVFRGLTLKLAIPKAALFSGLIFAAFHFNIFSFLPITVLGALFAWLYSRTGSLVPPMVAHAVFNGINFVLLGLLG